MVSGDESISSTRVSRKSDELTFLNPRSEVYRPQRLVQLVPQSLARLEEVSLDGLRRDPEGRGDLLHAALLVDAQLHTQALLGSQLSDGLPQSLQPFLAHDAVERRGRGGR